MTDEVDEYCNYNLVLNHNAVIVNKRSITIVLMNYPYGSRYENLPYPKVKPIYSSSKNTQIQQYYKLTTKKM